MESKLNSAIKKYLSNFILFLMIFIVFVVQFNKYFPNIHILHYRFSLMSFWGTLLLFMSIIYSFFSKLSFSEEHYLLVIVFVYILLFGYTRIHYFPYSFIYIFKFFLLFIVEIVFLNILEDVSKEKVGKFFLYAIYLSVIFAVVNIIYILLSGNNEHFYLLGFFEYKQHQGLVYAFVFPFLFFQQFSKSNSIFLIFVGALIFLSFDRKAILFMLSFLLINDFVNKTFFTGMFLLLFAFLSFIFHDNFMMFYSSKILNEIASNNVMAFGSGRSGIYLFSFSFFVKQMSIIEKFIGQGTGTNFIPHVIVVKTIKNAHIDFLHFLLDYGLIFVGGFGYILYRIYRVLILKQKIIFIVLIISLFYSIPSVYGIITLLMIISIILIGDDVCEKGLSFEK